MKLLELFQTDERAVSPVLGVALLIAMTVILAGVVGFVALGVNAGSSDAPQASLEFKENDTSNIDMYHQGGDNIETSNVVVKVNGTDATYTGWSSDKFTTGDVAQDVAAANADTRITISWEDPSSDRVVQLAEYTVE
ncbi:hypothetical protein BM92_16645 (plasmid) [Haloferax mediterranei ATCC 33500]|nr:hypothetical protein BM92_16645 [Haloferax mediterranei ATCC 33500]